MDQTSLLENLFTTAISFFCEAHGEKQHWHWKKRAPRGGLGVCEGLKALSEGDRKPAHDPPIKWSWAIPGSYQMDYVNLCFENSNYAVQTFFPAGRLTGTDFLRHFFWCFKSNGGAIVELREVGQSSFFSYFHDNMNLLFKVFCRHYFTRKLACHLNYFNIFKLI